MRTHVHRSALALVLGAALTTATLACGIPEENEPRAVAPERIPEQLETLPTNPPSSVEEVGQTETIYMIRADDDGEVRLVPWEVPITADPSPRALVSLLLAEENNPNLPPHMQTQVPPDLDIVEDENDDGVTRSDDLVRIRLNDELQNLQGPSQTQAIAQIVWTATQVDGVERVQLLDVNDEPIEVRTDDEAKEIVTRDDFDELRPLGS